MLYNAPFGATDTNASYVDGNPAAGIKGSIPPAAAIENTQREIVGVIADAGLTPSSSNLHQLALAIQSGKLNFAEDTGTANNLVVALARPPLTYSKGLEVVTKLLHDITGATVINVNALGNKPVVHSGGANLVSGDGAAGDLVGLRYDGANFQLIWRTQPVGSQLVNGGQKKMYFAAVSGGTTPLVSNVQTRVADFALRESALDDGSFSGGVFTSGAKSAGQWSFSAVCGINVATANWTNKVYLRKNGVVIGYSEVPQYGTATTGQINVSANAYLNVGDTVDVAIVQNTGLTQVPLANLAMFNGSRIGV